MSDAHALLGLQPGATTHQIKRAFRKLAMQWHPDRNPDPAALEHFRRLRQAHDRLLSTLLEDADAPDTNDADAGKADPAPARGADRLQTLEISFEDAFLGATRSVSVRTPQPCSQCGGTGLEKLSVSRLCEPCRGSGRVRGANGLIRCPDCDGKRYNPGTLEVTWEGRTIADVLGLEVSRAADVFAGEQTIARVLQSLVDVGLGYLRLGEPTPSLSGGEAQRLRLATELRRGQRHQLFVFDEPSIGLHPRDIHTLLGVFDRLLDAGATIVVIEHDTDMIANADHVIDIGPGAGDEGGHVIATGTVEEIRADADSVIGRWL